MPVLNNHNTKKTEFLRVLMYGPSHTKKTWWAGAAAEAGFNVLMLNGDGNFQVLYNLTEAAQARVRLINCKDGMKQPTFCHTIARLLNTTNTVVWDDVNNRVVNNFKNIDKEHGHFVLDVKKLTSNDVFVVDAWTSLCGSMLVDFANTHNIDLSDAAKQEWDGYGHNGRQATWVLDQLKALPCHVIVVAHEAVWEKRRGGKGPDKNDVLATRLQIVSTSANHAKIVPSKFTDCLHTELVGVNQLSIDGRPHGDQEGGSRVKAEIKTWDLYQFKDLVIAAHLDMPNGDEEMPGCVYYAPGDLPETTFESVFNVTLAASKGAQTSSAPKEIVPQGPLSLASLLEKGKQP